MFIQLPYADGTGAVVATYEKQRPFKMEPARQVGMPPAHFQGKAFSVRAVICFDLDFNFLVRRVARVGGVVAILANDWKEIEGLYTQRSRSSSRL